MAETAASTISASAKTMRGTKYKEKCVARNSLSSPFNCQWPNLQPGVSPDILAEVERTFQPLSNLLAKRKSKNRKQTEKKRAMEATAEKTVENEKRAALRSQIALGVNEVTRSLEKGQVRLVMVCRSAKPDLMTSHLCALSATRNCPAVAVYHLSDTLAPLLNLKVVLAIGFKKTAEPAASTEFDKLVAFVVERCPPIHIPWLDLQSHSPKDLADIISRDLFRTQKGQNVSPSKGQKKTLQQNQSQNMSVSVENVTKDTEQSTSDKSMKKSEVDIMQGHCEANTDNKLFTKKELPNTKKRKVEESSPTNEMSRSKKKSKIAKMQYASANIKQIKIISKVLKGKKKKGKRK